MENLKNRFIRYAKINTRSDEKSTTVPSTLRQVEFAKGLTQELIDLGFEEVSYNESNGFIMASIPATTDEEIDVLGFISHYDTADFESENINPQVVNYQGGDIKLNNEYALTETMFPQLKNYVGHTLITTDGTTLLGADDKAGITEIIEAMLYLKEHPEIKHGKVRIAFGPDEEIGRGADLFDVEAFGAKYAYTVDGGPLGELEYESFNAAGAIITFNGVSVHPGSAKGKMINALKLAMEFDENLPSHEVPEQTEGYEGFFFINDFSGTVEKAQASYFVRDHDRNKFEDRKELLRTIADEMNQKYGENTVLIEMKDQYYNMGEVISKDMRPVELAKKAMKNLNIEPNIHPIRGGTDGSKISFMGLLTPNLFTGGENYHGRYEFVSLNVMEKAKLTIIEIVKENALK